MSALKLVTAQPSTLADRVGETSARRAAEVREVVDEFTAALALVVQSGGFLAGLDGAAPGVRDLARRAGEDAAARALNVQSIMDRR